MTEPVSTLITGRRGVNVFYSLVMAAHLSGDGHHTEAATLRYRSFICINSVMVHSSPLGV